MSTDVEVAEGRAESPEQPSKEQGGEHTWRGIAEVDAELAAVPGVGAAPLSQSSVDYLAMHGGDDAVTALAELSNLDPIALHHDRVLAEARSLEQLLNSSLTIAQAAESLGVDRSRISHRLADQRLWSFTLRGRRHLPRWQFVATPDGLAELPGLRFIVPAIPTAMHPAAVESVMTSPAPDLDGRSPVELAASGGPVDAVVEWLTALAHE